ncbi:basic proline-rich protein-like [Hippopotamus amphibius kiboko]|uniref:basic proline-rich protein-like n=1 Tax=Hippopotamus amphibius kiboko TaxID=575201 RepID=UPI00259764CA|nr:basic proline-rich protein-like [Hippopotamus amphibius kiboko]
MVGRRGPTPGGTRPSGGGGAQPSGMARGPARRPEGAAAAGRRAQTLRGPERTRSGCGRGGLPHAGAARPRAPRPRRTHAPPRAPRAASRGGASRGRRSPAAAPRPRSRRRRRRGPGTRAAAPRRARPRGAAGLSLRGPRCRPSGSGGPRRAPGVPSRGSSRGRRTGREAGLRPPLCALGGDRRSRGSGPLSRSRAETSADSVSPRPQRPQGVGAILCPALTVAPTALAASPAVCITQSRRQLTHAALLAVKGWSPCHSPPPRTLGAISGSLPSANAHLACFGLTAPCTGGDGCADKDIKSNVTCDCEASAQPAAGDTAAPTARGRRPPSKSAPPPRPSSQCCPTQHPPPGVSAATPGTPNHSELRHLEWKPGLSLGTGPRPCCPGRPVPCVPHCPDLTGSGASGPFTARLLPGASHAPSHPNHPSEPIIGGGGGGKGRPPQPDRTEGGEGVGPLPAGCVSVPLSPPPAPQTGPGPGRLAARPHPCSAAPASRRPCGRGVGVHRTPRPARAAHTPPRTYPPPARCSAAPGPAPRSLSARRAEAALVSAPPRPPPARAPPPARGPAPRSPPLPPAGPWSGSRRLHPLRSAGCQGDSAAQRRRPGPAARGSRTPPGATRRPRKSPLRRPHPTAGESPRDSPLRSRPEIPRRPIPRPPPRVTLIACDRRPAGPRALPAELAPTWGPG